MPSRREYLGGLAAGALVGLAGCTDDEEVTGEWPRAGFGRQNTADATDRPGPGLQPTRAWHAAVAEDLTSTPALADGRLFVGYGTNHATDPRRVGFRVFDAASGDLERDVTVGTYEGDGATVYRDSLLVRDGAVYLLAPDGLHSFTTDGAERWHHPVDGSVNDIIQRAGHPVVADGTVYAPTASVTADTDGREGVLAVDDTTGDRRWRYEVPESADHGVFSLAYADGTIYASLWKDAVVALETATGQVAWRTEVAASGPPTIADGRVVVPADVPDQTGATALQALDAATGDPDWRVRTGDNPHGREIAATNGRLFAREGNTDLVCREAATGAEMWRYRNDAAVSGGRPVVMADAVYVGAGADRQADDGLVALDRTSGERRKRVPLAANAGPTARLAASTDRLFAVTATGHVFAIEACTPEVAGHCLP